MKYYVASLFVMLPLLLIGLQEDQNPSGIEIRERLGDVVLNGDWIYEDLNKGIAEAKKTGKPLLIVFR